MTDLGIKVTVSGQAEVAEQVNSAANKVSQTTSGMSGIIQKANQYFQQLTQSKSVQEQKDQEYHHKKLERITEEIEARKVLLEETKSKPATTEAEQVKRTLKAQSQQEQIERLEYQAELPAQRAVVPGSRFAGRKAMQIGGAVAGLMGAYSLFSKIGGGMQDEREARTELAGTMLTMPRTSTGFGEVKKMLTTEIELLGKAALITAKDMRGMIGALRETGDMSKESRKTQLQIANEAKRMNVDPAVVGRIQQNLLRYGGVESGEEYLSLQRGIGGRKGMSHRVEEMLKVQAETMMALSHGGTMTGGQTIKNILGLLDLSGMTMFSGERGGQFMQRIDQSFRSGGNEQFEQFQYLALSPMRQGKKTGTMAGGYGSGLYDAYVADWMQEQGAFATRSGMMEQAKKIGLPQMASYIGKTMTGEQTNIERVMAEVKKGLDIRSNEGDKLRFAAEFSDMLGGASATDIRALDKILSGPDGKAFLERAKKEGMNFKQTAGFANVWGDEGQSVEYVKSLETLETTWQKIGANLNSIVDDNRNIIESFAGYIKEVSDVLRDISLFISVITGRETEGIKEEIEKRRTEKRKKLDPLVTKAFEEIPIKGIAKIIMEAAFSQALSWQLDPSIIAGGPKYDLERVTTSFLLPNINQKTTNIKAVEFYRKTVDDRTRGEFTDEKFTVLLKTLAEKMPEAMAKRFAEQLKGALDININAAPGIAIE